MSPGSLHLGLPSAAYVFLDGILVSFKQQSVRGRQSPAALGWQALSARKHRAVPPAPPCPSPTCSTGALTTCQQTSAMSLALWALGQELHWGLPSAASLVVAVPMASTLALAGRVSCQCHTATSATGALDHVGAQELNHCRGLYVLVSDTSADIDWCSTWVPQRHRHSVMPVGTPACSFSDISSPKKARLEGAVSLGTSIHSESHTHMSYTLVCRIRASL